MHILCPDWVRIPCFLSRWKLRLTRAGARVGSSLSATALPAPQMRTQEAFSKRTLGLHTLSRSEGNSLLVPSSGGVTPTPTDASTSPMPYGRLCIFSLGPPSPIAWMPLTPTMTARSTFRTAFTPSSICFVLGQEFLPRALSIVGLTRLSIGLDARLTNDADEH